MTHCCGRLARSEKKSKRVAIALTVLVSAILTRTVAVGAEAPWPVSRAELIGEMNAKLLRVQSFVRERKLDGVLLSRVENFSWLTAGLADNHIVITSGDGAASLLVLADGRKFALASNSEMARLLSEDLKGLGFEPRAYPWHDDQRLRAIEGVKAGATIGSDSPLGNLPSVASEIAHLRYRLLPTEIRKYRWVGRETTAAVIAACWRVQPGMTEREMEAIASDELMRRGLRPTVLLMGVDERALSFRHPVPTDARLHKYAFINVCARRWGLVASVGRFVHFGPVPDQLRHKFEVSARVSAAMIVATKPGKPATAVLDVARRAYAAEGFAGEIEQHHQGGAIGYLEREWVATPGSKEIVQAPQAYAWNPIVAGALSFATVIVDEHGFEDITSSAGDWPMITVQMGGRKIQLPGILERSAGLHMQRNADGRYGVALGERFAQAAPVRIEFSDGAVVTTGYRDEQGNATLQYGGATFEVRDSWTSNDDKVELHRTLRVKGAAPLGFASAMLFEVRDGGWQPFAPGIIYGSSDHLTASAIGGRDSAGEAMRIREDRMPAPVFGLHSASDGVELVVLHCAPSGVTTREDGRETKAGTLIDGRFAVGALGMERVQGRVSMGFWYPGSEGVVTYSGDTYPGGQLKQWRRRFHPVLDGFSTEWTVQFRTGYSSSFREFYRDTWRWAWQTLQPRVNHQDIEALRVAITDMLAERVEVSADGRRGISNFMPAQGSGRVDPNAVMGFTGKNLEAAEFLLAESLRSTGERSARLRMLGEAIIDSFTRLKMSPPEGEGFELKSGKPVVAIRGGDQVYLRSYGDDMKALLRAVGREAKAGRQHPRWLAWAKQFGDWLLTQQQSRGGFPRAWRVGSGVVADDSPLSTYNAIPFLALLGERTGDPRYLEAALHAGEFAWSSGQESGVFVGGTIDNPDVIDKEAGTLSLEAYLALWERTHDERWIERARAAADYAETWIYIWDVPMAADEDAATLHWKPGIPTTGLQLISSGHSLVDEYMSFDVDEYARLARLAGEAHYLDVARLLLHNTKSMVALPGRVYDLNGPGWQQEHWSLAPRRGFGLHRAWLPWVATSQLNGIIGLEEYDAALFRELSDVK